MKLVSKKIIWLIGKILFGLIFLGFLGWLIYSCFIFQTKIDNLNQQLTSTNFELEALKSQDQYLINQAQSATISAVQSNFTQTITAYEALLDLKPDEKTKAELDKLFTQILSYLADMNYASASAALTEFNAQLKVTQATAKVQSAPAQPAVASNTPPASGFSRQSVTTDIGSFTVSLVAADLNSSRVIVDTASDSTCANDCPVLPLATYVSRSGAFAGINGSYFCPASYPTCAGKTNSFDTLLMNKNKVYFNSDNNVYSTVPAVLFSGSSARFVSQSLELGRDTGPDSVIANQPLLVKDGQVVFGGDDDPKKGSKGNRSFVAAKATTVYLGVVHSATVAESARVLKALGMDNALNLDDGGSTALWSNGYRVGPGRDIPNAVLLVNR